MLPSWFLLYYDYYYLWAAGHLSLAGGNPYDLAQLRETLYRIGWPVEEGVFPFSHPPTVFWLYSLFALLPFQLSAPLWGIISLVLIIGTSLTLAPLLGDNERPTSRWKLASCGMGALVFPFTLMNPLWGQVNVLLLVGLVLFWRESRKGRPITAGLALSLTLVKPHLLLPLYFYLLGKALLSKDPRTILALAAGGVTHLATSLFVAPDSLGWYLSSLQSEAPGLFALVGAAPGQIIDQMIGQPVFRTLLAILGISLGLLIGLRDLDLRSSILFILPFSLVCAPYFWPHSLLLLLPNYLDILLHSAPSWGSPRRLIAALTCAFLHELFFLPLFTVYTFIPLICLGWNIHTLRMGKCKNTSLRIS
jgi:hypothetical protein